MIRVTCHYCPAVRYYDPGDMRFLLGDVEIDSLRRRLKCEVCNKRDYMEVEGLVLSATEKVGLNLRRLRGVRLIRRPIWEDVPM